jgi:DNA-binding transcriptional regulator YiaG
MEMKLITTPEGKRVFITATGEEIPTGRAIQAIRHHRKENTAAFGAVLGVSRWTVEKWEGNQYPPHPPTLTLLGIVMAEDMECLP